MPDLPADQPTEAEVDAAERHLPGMRGVAFGEPRLSAVREALTAALAVSPHREQVQKLTEALEWIADEDCRDKRLQLGRDCLNAYPIGTLQWCPSCTAVAALDGPSSKGEQ